MCILLHRMLSSRTPKLVVVPTPRKRWRLSSSRCPWHTEDNEHQPPCDSPPTNTPTPYELIPHRHRHTDARQHINCTACCSPEYRFLSEPTANSPNRVLCFVCLVLLYVWKSIYEYSSMCLCLLFIVYCYPVWYPVSCVIIIILVS